MNQTATKKNDSASSVRSAQSSAGQAATIQLTELPELADYLKAYARNRPDVTALWCFGIGFVLGWKLKPW